jgi:hypothetical protein
MHILMLKKFVEKKKKGRKMWDRVATSHTHRTIFIYKKRHV